MLARRVLRISPRAMRAAVVTPVMVAAINQAVLWTGLLRAAPALVAAGLMEMRRYAAVRRATPLHVLPLAEFAAWAAEAGLTLRVAPANLTFRASRVCVVLTRA